MRFGKRIACLAALCLGLRGQEPAPEERQISPPPFTEGIFPCSGCHGTTQKPNPTRRTLIDFHDDIQLRHGGERRWCTDCHDLLDRDRLRLADGSRLDFTASHLLCGQCHGDKHRDWRVGIHGKRTGNWNGEKRYLLCVHCHNPHAPRFAPLKPMPPPRRPGGRP